MPKKMPLPTHGLSVQYITAESRHVDWDEVRGENCDGYTIILPEPTYGDWQDRDSNAPAHIDRRKHSTVMNDDDRDAFEETDAYHEWRDSFEPLMNYVWPVSLAYGVDAQAAATLIEQFGSACSLLELGEDAQYSLFGYGSDSPDYVIVLTGGGMNLSDHIAAAYLACGCVPPETILSGLSGVISPEQARALPLRAAYKRAAQYFTARAKRMRDEAQKVFKAN